ncbi:PBSX family phage terminase large subunit [Mechercharimyces sp. CAU 1602]|uniref:PBSX family phage terminase large subunit n=1 Tax=Mechercharimyces sp. CAU 1602 TaxID=2973933 RepID=UPI0021632C32|nr:PBSX family phage terminase large subunit [Mechercharimyces sp. CAU 1602]MCS1350287.1 PBSX family phage terminase large subunit [Mechercharimyces sp. CAU 1602]
MGRKRNNQVSAIQFEPYSQKQLKPLTWWMPNSPYENHHMYIADGSIRSGKTISMIDGFTTWATECFRDENFILAGKSMGALKRNVLAPMFQILSAKGISYHYHRGENPHVLIGSNTYYLFGANNESSQDSMQGLTSAGAYADEAALFPESFVDQMIGRCSVEGAKTWLNCNPKGPRHWLKTKYIDQKEDKRILHLTFLMNDNLSLPESTIERYKRMFTGVFYQRNILGQWVMADGLIYSMFDEDRMAVSELPEMRKYWIRIDYGTSNATTFMLSGLGIDGRLYIIDEYYHSGRESQTKKSPSKYAEDFLVWRSKHRDHNNHPIHPEWVYIDPSADGFLLELRSRGVRRLAKANNEVSAGIGLVQSIMDNDLYRVHKCCTHHLDELNMYTWDYKAQQRGEDKPVKENDHTCNPIRYIANGTRHLK